MGGVTNTIEFLELFSSGFMGGVILPFLAITAVLAILCWVVFK